MLRNLDALFLLNLAGFNGKSDHLFFLGRELLFLFLVLTSLSLFFLSSNARHLQDQSHLLILFVEFAGSAARCHLLLVLWPCTWSLHRLGIVGGSVAGLFHQLLHGDLIDLHILLGHHFLERFKVFDRQDLVYDARVSRAVTASLTRCFEELK